MIWIWLIFVFAWGACVGSFLNVVIYRIPEGLSIVRPASACPMCGHRLAWYDNVPVLGWLWLMGKCRYCKARISVQYPIIELLTGLLFGGLLLAYYHMGWRPGFDQFNAGQQTWPGFLVHLTLVATMIAATVIDARLFIIPLVLPWLATVVAIVVLPVAAFALPGMEAVGPAVNEPIWIGAAAGGMVGLLVSLALLKLGVIPRSMPQEEDPQNVPADMPFAPLERPRLVVLKELIFLAPPLLGMAVGGLLLADVPMAPHRAVSVLAGVLLGYLVGGGVIWMVRILGTLGFGKEAMGLGDVHLLGAIGAVVGAVDSVAVFFVAPFFGLAAAAVLGIMSKLKKGEVRMIPYGPHLCGGALVVMALRQPLGVLFDMLYG